MGGTLGAPRSLCRFRGLPGARGLRAPGRAGPASPPPPARPGRGRCAGSRSPRAGTEVKGGQLGFGHLWAAAAPLPRGGEDTCSAGWENYGRRGKGVEEPGQDWQGWQGALSPHCPCRLLSPLHSQSHLLRSGGTTTCPVTKAGGHSLWLRIRRHISALASSQDNFLKPMASPGAAEITRIAKLLTTEIRVYQWF